MSVLIVLAKAPAPGRSKTRLTPPCTPAEAAALAEAALVDTLATAMATGAEVVVALDGERGAWLPPGVDVVAQRGACHAARIAAAFEDVGERAFLIGMDTPQLEVEALRAAAAHDCALGLALDGGWWGLGLPGPDSRVFECVPMSTAETGARQRARLHALGYRPVELGVARDVDTIDDAWAVAALAPGSRFAACLTSIEPAAPSR